MLRLKEKKGLNTYSFNSSFVTIKDLTRSCTGYKIAPDDNQNNLFDAKGWLVEARKPRDLNDLASLLSTSNLLEEHKHDQLHQFILVAEASDPDEDFKGGDN